MEGWDIRDVTGDNIEDLINLCVPVDRRENTLFIEGAELKRRWAAQMCDRYGTIAKIAYVDSKPAGLIQYSPNVEERVIEISCIFIPDKALSHRGIGRALLASLIEDMRQEQPCLNSAHPLALVTWAFEVVGWYSQSDFLRKMGFRQIAEDPLHLYYPLKEGFVYVPRRMGYIPQEGDAGRILLFFTPSCPFCIPFLEGAKAAIKEVAPDVPLRAINQFEEQEEVKERGKIPFCAVNRKPIQSFFLDKDNFQKEIKEALDTSSRRFK